MQVSVAYPRSHLESYMDSHGLKDCTLSTIAKIQFSKVYIYLGDGLEVAGRFQVVNTMASRLSVGEALGNGALATTTTNSNAVDDESCDNVKFINLVSQTTKKSLIWL